MYLFDKNMEKWNANFSKIYFYQCVDLEVVFYYRKQFGFDVCDHRKRN